MLGGTSDPDRLEGRAEDAKPREFFWDSVTKYIVGVIIGLAAIDTITEFVRGSSISCLSPEGNEDFINNYCSSSIPRSEYFPAFIAVHAILILIPHSLWVNRYNGNFEFFFTQSRELDRTRDHDTGFYSEKNYLIVDQLDKAFTTYNQNWMYISYLLKLVFQLIVSLTGFMVAVFYFTDFNEVFLCPHSYSNSSLEASNPLWPLNGQVTCVFKSIRLFAILRLADLVLLTILVLAYLWSLVWCTSSHSSVLGTDQVAKFSFQSSISPHYHLFDSSALRNVSSPLRKLIQIILDYVPLCGSEPHVHTNLDFLMLKLFRTDSGLGFVLREMQILLKIKELNDHDQRIVNLHRVQQRAKDMKTGDIINDDAPDRDVIWKFPKEAGQLGIFHATPMPLGVEDPLALPQSMRGAVLGFASLASCRSAAMFVSFGSTSLGIPNVLARVFSRVYILNFNPYFKKKNDSDRFFFFNKYSSEIHNINYPEDILSSEYEKSNDFGSALKDITDKMDFVVVGPVEKAAYISTLSLSLNKITRTKLKENCLLLTIIPTKIGSKDATRLAQFHPYVPSKRHFGERKQRVRLLRRNATPSWPPSALSQDKDDSIVLSNCTFNICMGTTDAQVRFNLYDRTMKEGKPSVSAKTEGTAVSTNDTSNTSDGGISEKVSAAEEAPASETEQLIVPQN